LGTSGISGGVTTALDRVASYYLQLADQITGVIEVPPGRAVSLVVLRGTELKLMTTKR
jgi:conjugal transfer pilus assembly protein TraB